MNICIDYLGGHLAIYLLGDISLVAGHPTKTKNWRFSLDYLVSIEIRYCIRFPTGADRLFSSSEKGEAWIIIRYLDPVNNLSRSIASACLVSLICVRVPCGINDPSLSRPFGLYHESDSFVVSGLSLVNTRNGMHVLFLFIGTIQ